MPVTALGLLPGRIKAKTIDFINPGVVWIETDSRQAAAKASSCWLKVTLKQMKKRCVMASSNRLMDNKDILGKIKTLPEMAPFDEKTSRNCCASARSSAMRPMNSSSTKVPMTAGSII